MVDRVHLVFQQASVIRANCDARVKELCGDMNVDAWKADRWAEIWDTNDICVLTAQIFLDNLQSGFLTLDRVNIYIAMLFTLKYSNGPFCAGEFDDF